MPCDSMRRPRRRFRRRLGTAPAAATKAAHTAAQPAHPTEELQTLEERKVEVKQTIEALDRAILRRQVKVVVGPQGAINFTGWTEEDRNGITDACAYRRLMVSGSAIAKAEIARAEALAGRTVDRKILSQGVHSHDGGRTWGKD